jgi:hypothetical protein
MPKGNTKMKCENYQEVPWTIKTKHRKCTNIWRENKSFERHQQPIKAKTTNEHHRHTTFATKTRREHH